MSGPKSYTPYISPEMREKLRREAEERMRQEKYNAIMNDIRKRTSDPEYMHRLENELAAVGEEERQRILESAVKFTKASIGTDFSEYKEDRIPTQAEVAGKKRAEYDAAMLDYRSICAVMGMQPADCFDYQEERCDELVSQMISETERLKQVQLTEAQNRMIYESSLQVLRDMGYEIIGSDTIRKRSGAAVSSTLFRLDDDTAINLTCTSNGQYTFETVGISSDSHSPSESEIRHIYDVMCTTCPMAFSEFMDRLSQKDIRLTEVNKRPPDIEQCRIKNISSYSQDTSAVQTVRTVEKRQTTSEQL